VTVAVVAGAALASVLERIGTDEDVIALVPSAARLDELMRLHHDPRVVWLIGDGHVLPLPNASVDEVVGEVDEAERRRVLRE